MLLTNWIKVLIDTFKLKNTA